MPSDDFGKLLVQAYMRASAGLFVSVFGSPEQRARAGLMFDQDAPEAEKESARQWLDRVAEKIAS